METIMLRFSTPSRQPSSSTVIERHHLPTGTVTHVQSNQPTATPMPTVVLTAPVILPPPPAFVAPVPTFVGPTPVLTIPPIVDHSRTVITPSNATHVTHRPTQHTALRHHTQSSSLLRSGPSFTPLQGIHKARHHKPKAAATVMSTTQASNHPTRHIQVAQKRKTHK